MTDSLGQGPKPGHAQEPTYTCTLGVYNQTTPWSDVRSLTWTDLTALLTQHEVGAKEGTCLVPAVFSGTKRAKAEAVRIDVVFLDSDAGYTLQEISAAIAAEGWQAIISSSHSHLTTKTKVKRGNWDKYRAAAEDTDDLPTRYLVEAKGYLARIAAGTTVGSETDEFTIFEHQPCPKFRVAIPLLRPWLAAGYGGQREANAAWKDRIEALAAALGLSHDQACTDTSRPPVARSPALARRGPGLSRGCGRSLRSFHAAADRHAGAIPAGPGPVARGHRQPAAFAGSGYLSRDAGRAARQRAIARGAGSPRPNRPENRSRRP